MVKQEPPWINSVVQDMFSRTGGKILPSIQVREAYLDEILSIEEFKEALIQASKAPAQGVIFWSWEALEQDPEKKKVIREWTGKATR